MWFPLKLLPIGILCTFLSLIKVQKWHAYKGTVTAIFNLKHAYGVNAYCTAVKEQYILYYAYDNYLDISSMLIQAVTGIGLVKTSFYIACRYNFSSFSYVLDPASGVQILRSFTQYVASMVTANRLILMLVQGGSLLLYNANTLSQLYTIFFTFSNPYDLLSNKKIERALHITLSLITSAIARFLFWIYITFMSFWRSSTVNCYQLILPRENAHRIIQQLGRLSNVAFRASPPQTTFAAQVKVIEEALLKLRLLQERLKMSEGVSSPDSYSKEEFEAFLQVVDRKYRLEKRASAHTLETTIQEICEMWDKQGQLIDRIEGLKTEGDKLHQQRTILKAGETLFGSTLYARAQAEQSQRQINFKCGLIGKQEEAILRRTLFRMTKGLSIYTSIDYSQVWPQNEAIRQQKQGKAVFFLIFGYGQSRALSNKVQKLLQNYAINSYQYPQSEEQLRQRTKQIEQKVESNAKMVQLVNSQMKDSLHPLMEAQYSQSKLKFSKFQYCKLYLLHQRKIYQRLNHMRLHHNFYQTFVFIQARNIQKVTTELHQKLINDQMPSPQFIPFTTDDLPTLFELNSITTTPYEILCAYGTPHYKQVNPAMLNLTTFPFLFGVMFGDMAHGAILFALGLLLIFRPIEHPVADFFRSHRYTIALMGFFSFYCGLIYNQYLSLSLNLFGSCYNISNGTVSPRNNCVYPVGLDPIWSIAVNNLNFTNSLKMKIAVIIAIVHMTLGLVVKALNCWYFKKKARMFIDVLPQIMFLLAIFGYMDYLIIFKWLHQWTASAPSIITTMINIPMYFGGTSDCCGGEPMWGTFGDTSQDKIQKMLLIAAFTAIPAMFFLPILHEALSRKTKMQKESQMDLKDELSEAGGSKRQEQGLFQSQKDQQLLPMQEIVVYQLIETIQFVLGCISNTASYLRLWALSLAHSQLSQVFFNETVTYGLDAGFIGILYNLALFPIFAGITLGILMCMDTMECFLHTLRLHWVEFQSKFYKGDGKQFKSDDFLTYLNAQLKREKK